mgnify:CR=1 FL=1
MNILEYEIITKTNTCGAYVPIQYLPVLYSSWFFRSSAALARRHGAYIYKEGLRSYICRFKEYQVTAPSLVVILPGQLHSIDQYMDKSMEYENIIFSLSMLLPGKYDYTRENFLTPLLAGKFTVPTVFTPVYPYYEDVVAPIDACDEICKTMPQGYQLYIKSKLYEFFFCAW